MKEKVKHMARALYDSCMTELLNNPDITQEEASGLIVEITEQATDEEGNFVTERFRELFSGTLEAMGMDTTLTPKEDSMFSKKGWEVRAKLGALSERVKGIKLKMPENVPTDEEAGAAVGKRISNVAKYPLKVYDRVRNTISRTRQTTKAFYEGFKTGWKNG